MFYRNAVRAAARAFVQRMQAPKHGDGPSFDHTAQVFEGVVNGSLAIDDPGFRIVGLAQKVFQRFANEHASDVKNKVGPMAFLFLAQPLENQIEMQGRLQVGIVAR